MRFAYADPPYIGQARKHYAHDERCAEVNHEQLIATLEMDFDAWALSASSPSLRAILPLCPESVRVAAWVKPFCSFKPGVTVAYAWEPIILRMGRKRPKNQPTVRDWVSCNITLRKGLSGVKPREVCHWLFEVMALRPDDEFVDVFPGSGAVTDAWGEWCAQQSLFPIEAA